MKAIIKRALNKERIHSDAGVERILDKKLAQAAAHTDFAGVWDFASYGLDKVACIGKADPDAQRQILQTLALGRLYEAWAIEKAGMSYAAKMGLLAESLNEQKLYSLFGAEEARHFHFIDQTLGELAPSGETGDPFIALLNEIIIGGGRRPLQFVIQIVLEGWGIEHYALLDKTCKDPQLKAALRLILADEAAHHGSGLALFREAELTRAEREYIFEIMSVFLGMVRIGPVAALGAIEAGLGGWAPGQKNRVLIEMDAYADTARKLSLLEGFLIKAGASKILERLRAAGAFTPDF